MTIDKLARVRRMAGELAGKCRLEFYDHFSAEHALSRDFFFSHPMIIRLREDVLPFLNDGFGHGIEHSKKVAIDAGILAMVETKSWNNPVDTKRICTLAQMAGLLHDICRHDQDHARKGAEFSSVILACYAISDRDREDIAFAVNNHEAFRDPVQTDDPGRQLLSDILYDADKFRWGPDNFITTLWEICCFEDWTIQEIVDRFPGGMDFMEKINETFRTETGRTYGPEFIRCGFEVGGQVYRLLQEDYEPLGVSCFRS
jgi:hypothetical protein